MASIVHNPGRREHYTSESLHKYLAARTDVIIGDAMAQTIAAFWHSPNNPNSTLLSTQGKVSSDMSIEDFALERSWWSGAYLDDERIELDALERYILHYQANPTTPTGVHPCACMDCFDLQYSREGDLCRSCKEAGCSGDQGDECERDDAYGCTNDLCDCND